MMIRALRAFAASVLVLVAICGAASAGDRAPDFSVVDVAGERVSLSSFTGKPVIVNFWATWCPPCRAELPYFDKLAAEHEGAVQFMMVDLTDGRRETIEVAKAFVEREGYSFPIFFDTEYEGASAYGVRAIPTTVVVDARGEIADVHIGAMDESTLRGYVDRVTKGR